LRAAGRTGLCHGDEFEQTAWYFANAIKAYQASTSNAETDASQIPHWHLSKLIKEHTPFRNQLSACEMFAQTNLKVHR
jgi:hypothetical protein